VFPLYLQTRVWPEVQNEASRAKNKMRISACATGHNTIHFLIDYYMEFGDWPEHPKRTSEVHWAKMAIKLYEDAKALVGAK
jgi:hypothetical protein